MLRPEAQTGEGSMQCSPAPAGSAMTPDSTTGEAGGVPDPATGHQELVAARTADKAGGTGGILDPDPATGAAAGSLDWPRAP